MEKAKQTDELKVRVYNLTLSFVRKYQPRYYMQYRGESEDLALDFYCQFLTPKSREKGKEESLLDKYNDEITSLEYLLKVSVQRMLIDRSRQDTGYFKSIDEFVDEFGDFMTQTFGLSTEDEEVPVDEHSFSLDFVLTCCARFDSLTESAKKSITRQYLEVKNVIAPAYRKLFEAVIDPKPAQVVEEPEELFVEIEGISAVTVCPVQQVTPKTIVAYHSGDLKEFNRENGEARGKNYRNLCVSDKSLRLVSEIKTYHCGLDREKFILSLA